MLNKDLLYKIVRYMGQATLIYLLFRYFPKSKMGTKEALLATLVIVLVCILIERLIVNYMSKNNEPFNQGLIPKPCTSCGAEHFTDDGKGAKTCKLVCEYSKSDKSKSDDKSKENFNGELNKDIMITSGDGTNVDPNYKPKEVTLTREEIGPNRFGKDMEGIERTTNNKDRDVYRYNYGQPNNVNLRAPLGSPSRDETLRDTQVRDQSPTTVEIRPDPPRKEPVQKPANDDRFYWGSRYGNLGYDSRYGFGGMFYDEYPFYNRFRNNDMKNIQNTGKHIRDYDDARERERREQTYIKELKRKMDDKARTTDGYKSAYQEVGSRSEKDRTMESRRRIEGPIDNELPYTDYNHLPVAAGYKSHDYEYGYSFLPPEKWFVTPPRPPICVTEKRCPVMPVYSQGTPVDVKEWHSARRVSPPDLINTDYIGDKLNSGR